MKRVRLLTAVFGFFPLGLLALPACNPAHAGHGEHSQEEHHEHGKIVATRPLVRDVTVTLRYVCQIRSQRNIEVCAMQGGYLQDVAVKEGQVVKQGELLFRILPTLYKARLDAELAEANLAELEYKNAKRLHDDKVVSIQEVMLHQAKLDKARAKAQLATAEVAFTEVRAPFDGIVDRILKQQGSLIKEGGKEGKEGAAGDVLTTLSDNSTMWVYFNVPEARYLDDMASRPRSNQGTRVELADSGIELQLANGSKFRYTAGTTVTVEGQCDPETGNFKYRADFPNPDGLLRNGQTGNVLIHRVLPHAVIVPQRATFEILDKRFVYVIDEHHVAHQREIQVEREMDDVFVVRNGVGPNDKIVLDGVREVRDGDHLKYDEVKPADVLGRLKTHAE